MNFQPERLMLIREQLGISKAEAARILNMSAMGYGRYESGEREPSFQTVSFIAQQLGTSVKYLYGETENADPSSVTVSAEKDPELFDMIQNCMSDEKTAKRLLSYFKKLR
ncbi:MAG: helix-turn-helix transcriptional regulator [Parasporobacterium sp.]|nr:helix-turn-helix transcriptional regulator [Parasporobacterium sp.]